ncbi:hypothetical protein AB0G97_03310 [Streptomyces sp. NPDC020755]|uniref:hypothetical protein n=1 Tax=Streptomyces sp. NPDC020755 TaxID=3154790 RepID=UPI0034012E78
MRDILRTAGLTGLSDRDIPPVFREVVERGWSVTASGGRVLTALRPEIPGPYFDRLAEETTSNGRGMTDYDLPAPPHERTPRLVRRCMAYVCACLRTAQEEFGDAEVRAYVFLSFADIDTDADADIDADADPGLLTSNVTFCTPLPDVRPYIPALEDVQDAAVAEISVEDCSAWS